MSAPDLDAFKHAAARTVQALADYAIASRAGEGPAVRLPPIRELAESLDVPRLIREGGLFEERYFGFLDDYL
ncbi:MAG: hypothetical protein ACREVN_03590, partial [Gammaproteobacteria bacterium]